MDDLSVLIAAAGRGSRAGLPYPKTLYPIHGKPILMRIADVVEHYDSQPTVIVSPEGEQPIRDCLVRHGRAAHLVIQPHPNGMGDAVLCFARSPEFARTRQIVLVWGDIPMIAPATLDTLIGAHFSSSNDFTFATRWVDSAYTVVSRNPAGQVVDVVECRELGIQTPQAGERDIGLFVFRKDLVLDALRDELPGKRGSLTGEHGFLYIIAHLVERGCKVEALRIATELDLVSLNSLSDVIAYI